MPPVLEAQEREGLPPRIGGRQWRFTGFPIVAWWGPPGTARREDFEAYRDAGFTLHATNPDEGFSRALDHAQAVGLKSLVFRQHQGFALTPLEAPAFAAEHDAVVGWITADEPADRASVMRAAGAVRDLMRADPTRWAFFNLLSPHLQKDPPTEAVIDIALRSGMPLLSYDTYALMADGADRADLLYASLDRFRRASLEHDVPFWAFALTIGHLGYRRPSESDLRWQHFSNLAYGAKGLWYFTYWGPTGWPRWDPIAIVDPRDGSTTALYGWVRALNLAVLGMGETLLGLTSVDVVHTHPPVGQRTLEPGRFWIEGIEARDALVGFFRAADGAAYAMVVNKQHGMGKRARETADTLVLRLSDRVEAVDAVSWLDGVTGPLPIRDGRAWLTVAGGTGVLLRATLREPGPTGPPPLVESASP